MNPYLFTCLGGFKGASESPLDVPAPFTRGQLEAIVPTLPGWEKDMWRTII